MGEKITVAQVSIKRGENEKGKWVNTRITPTEGKKWTGFLDGLALLQQGDVIEVDEYEEGTGKNLNRILKYHKLESTGNTPATRPVEPSAGSSSGGYGDDSPIKRLSIEAQKAAELTANLWGIGKLNETSEEVTLLKTWIKGTLTRATTVARPAVANPTTATADGSKVAQSTGEALKTLKFANPGQFMAAAHEKWPALKSDEILRLAGVSDPKQLEDYKKAWEAIEKSQTKTQGPA